MKKKSIPLYAIIIGIICSCLSIVGCTKSDSDCGTVAIKALSPTEDIRVSIYPYVADYEKMMPIDEAVISPETTAVSFKLTSGNYVVSCRYSNGTFKEMSIQVRPGQKTRLELTDRSFIKK